MKSWLTIGIIAAMAVTYVGSAQTPPEAPAQYDIHTDGQINLLDFVDLAQFYNQPAAPCLHSTKVHYVTPVTASQDGTDYLVEGRAYPDPNDPLVPSLLAGTPVYWC